MAEAFAPIDRSVLDSFRNSDERALEQIVRQGFPALAAAASAESEDDVAAARVIEGAFVAAWAERAKFETPDALEEFLRMAVHRNAVREKSRRAALHRFETHEKVNVLPRNAAGVPLTADEIWSRVNTVLHTPRPSTESTARIRADVSRHEAAAHVAGIGKRRSEGMSTAVVTVLSALLAVAAIGGLVWFLQPSGATDGRLEAALGAQDVRMRATEAGQRASVELLDGSRVMLGASSRLRIPKDFGPELRGVGLEGTATFQVQPGGERTFVVKAGNARVRVTGTKFDVSAYADKPVVVRVREGSVDVVANEVTRSIREGGVVLVQENGVMTDATPDDVAMAVGWADDQFVVVGKTLREVVPLMNRWYRLNVNVADEKLLDRTATVRAALSSSRQAIEQVEQTANVKFGYEGENRIFRDAAEPPRPAGRRR